MDNIFQTIRETIDKEQFRDYVSSKYGIEFKGRAANGFCPFHDHDHDTPSLGIANGKSGGAFFHCFACGASGDIVRFTEMKRARPRLMPLLRYANTSASRIISKKASSARSKRRRSRLEQSFCRSKTKLAQKRTPPREPPPKKGCELV